MITALLKFRFLFNIGINIVFFNLFSEDAGIIYTVGKVRFPALRVFSDFLAEKDLLGYLPANTRGVSSLDRNAVRVNNEMLLLKYFTTKVVESREG